MPFEFSKSLVVVGANSDIGSELVRHAARQNEMRVLALSRSPAIDHENDCNNIVRIGGLDLREEKSINKVATAVDNVFSKSFSIIHCVGDFWLHKPLLETSFEEIQRLMISHYLTLCVIAQALTPLMLTRGGGRLVAFGCNSVNYNYPDMAPFTSAKAAVECFIKCFAHEHAKDLVSAFVLALPTIRTEKVVKAKPQGDHANYITSNEIADFLVSHVLMLPHEMSGNVIKLVRYSPTFYHSSYYDRNPRI